jgi:hypothetical protein
MSSVPVISVVVPTHDRAALLPTTLTTLARQTIAPDAYEVIVVADGCRDAPPSSCAARARRTDSSCSRKRTRVSRPLATAARATRRRVGAVPRRRHGSDARIPRRHLAAHAARPGGVVLGAIPSVVHGTPDDPLGAETRRWWANRAIERAQPSHRFTASDLFGGNLSLPRALFRRGGWLRRGVRLPTLGRGLRARRPSVAPAHSGGFVHEAEARHHDKPTFARALARATADGRAHVLLARDIRTYFPRCRSARRCPGAFGAWCGISAGLDHRQASCSGGRCAAPSPSPSAVASVGSGAGSPPCCRRTRIGRRTRGARSRGAWDALSAGARRREVTERDYDLADGFAGAASNCRSRRIRAWAAADGGGVEREARGRGVGATALSRRRHRVRNRTT